MEEGKTEKRGREGWRRGYKERKGGGGKDKKSGRDGRGKDKKDGGMWEG